LNPEINMWHVAKPVVEEYIRESIGPKALARDLGQTARILTRFGPHLPRLVEEALIAQADRQPRHGTAAPRSPFAWVALGGGLVGLGVVIGALL
jgi:ubiquinone biosynthesis protein